MNEYPKYQIVETTTCHIRHGVTHTYREINIDDLKYIELKFPNEIITRSSGEIETSDNDWKIKLAIYDRIILDFKGYDFSIDQKDRVPIKDKILVYGEATKFKVIEKDDMLTAYPDICEGENQGYWYEYALARQGGTTIPIQFTLFQPEGKHIEAWKRISAYKQIIKKNKVNWKSKAQALEVVNLFNELIIDVKGYSLDKDGTEAFTPIDTPARHKIIVINNMMPEILGMRDDFEGN